MRIVIALLTFSFLVGTSGADVPPIYEFTATMAGPAHLWVSPSAHGHDLQHAYGPGWGGQVDGTILVQLMDGNGMPIFGYPREDIWLADDGPSTFVYCPGGTIADDETDGNGETIISGPFWAGGQIMPDGQPRVFVAGTPIQGAALPLTINSPDVNGDLEVNLSDIPPFVQALYGGYDFRMDFNYDGVINLVDISIFAMTLGEQCP